MAQVEFIISLKWLKLKTDLSTCTGCEDIIYSDMNVLLCVTDNKISETDIKLCASCFDATNKD